jgi:Contractile injection system tape measure protein
MPIAQRHIIRQVKLSLQMNQTEQVGHVQKEVNRIFKEAVLPELSILFDELIPPDQFLRVPKLKIDLGQFSPDLLPSEWQERCRAALREALMAWLSNSAGEPEGQIFVPKAQHAWEAFLFFLDRGSLPWWFPKPEMEKWEFEVLTALQDKSGNKTEQLFRLLKSKPGQFQRFIRQFSPAFLWSVLMASVPETKDFVSWIKQTAPMAFTRQAAEWREFLQQLFSRALHSNAGFFVQKLSLLMAQVQSGAPSPAVTKLTMPEQLLTIWEELWREAAPLPEQPTRVTSPEPASESQMGQPENTQDAGMYIDNAGLVVVAPFIAPFFHGLGLVAANKFVSAEATERAIALLRYLVDGREEAPEYVLAFEKILCDVPTDWPLRQEIVLSEHEKNEAEKMLTAAIGHWTALKQCSIAALRETFLQRQGKLQRREDGWLLQPERKTVDILLDRLPWSIGMVKLPWMQKMIWVEW